MAEAEGDEILYCSLCNGRGQYNGEACPACGGVGKFLAPDKWVYCSLCNGRGIFKNTPCPACNGRGKVRPKSL